MATPSVFTNLLLPLTTPAAWREKLEIDLTTLGVSPFMQTLLDDTTATAALATLGVVSGTYTPTLFNTTNVAASTAYTAMYFRIGNIVSVAALVDIDPTASPANTELGISLPIASNFTDPTELAGTGSTGGQTARLYADATNNRATLFIVSTSAANVTWSHTFTYRVI